MSHKASSAAWQAIRSNPDLTALQRLVLLALADRMNGEERCWPTLEQLHADTALGISTVRKTLAALVALGLISRQAQFTPAGANKHNDYRLTAPATRSDRAGTHSHRAPPPLPQSASPTPTERVRPAPTERPSKPESVKPVKGNRRRVVASTTRAAPKGNPGVSAFIDVWRAKHPGVKAPLDGSDFKAIKNADEMAVFDAEECVAALDSVNEWGDNWVRDHPQVRTVINNMGRYRQWAQPALPYSSAYLAEEMTEEEREVCRKLEAGERAKRQTAVMAL